MDHPVFTPDAGCDLSEERSLSQLVAKLGAKDVGEGFDGQEKVRAGRAPATVISEAAACRLSIFIIDFHFFGGLASRKSFTIRTIMDMRFISVTCVVSRNIANLDGGRGCNSLHHLHGTLGSSLQLLLWNIGFTFRQAHLCSNPFKEPFTVAELVRVAKRVLRP